MPPGLLQTAIVASPIPLFSGPLLLLFITQFPRRGSPRRAVLMSLPALLIFAWLGSVLGDNIGYLIGKTICRATIIRYGGKIGLTNARISAVEETFSRYGSATVLFARFFPVLRQLNGIVAGALRMPGWRFLLFNAVGAAMWVGTWVSIIYFSAHTVAAAHFANKVVLGLIIVLISFVVWRLRHHGG